MDRFQTSRKPRPRASHTSNGNGNGVRHPTPREVETPAVDAGRNLLRIAGEQWLDTKQAAAILECAPGFLAELVAHGKLILHTRVGHYPFFSQREVTALANERQRREFT